MKVLPFKIPKPDSDSLIFQVDKDIKFYDKLHQHEEIQISFVVEGEGTLLVGDRVNYYKKGDVLVIGGNLPHVFKSDLNASEQSYMLSLFFTESSFGDHFFYLEELKEIKPLFKKAIHGFKVLSRNKLLADYFSKLHKVSKLERFIILLEILKICTYAKSVNLSSFQYNKKYTDNEGERMRNIFEYTMNHFEKDISLQTIADVANMTKNAFCKYFKKRTNKTYFQFLNELRIENACKLLIKNQDLSIAYIAEQSGFNNISNFNRQFKFIKKHSPSKYRKVGV
ncbi:AraC family transcriptional regulator [Sabulilitoribacter multivorans]|uniref:AraC family transcriptional regulator n=1 Tax=Flaviramulus multivorans TaxID=1304750 RepID=A0ABS9IKX6_9FLAO|nr:AraC family transcriptional regulator [Flaviramulus multivorans]MCF7561254.1 AraC family transcriptional regulator [Flaviramulus multivorans]